LISLKNITLFEVFDVFGKEQHIREEFHQFHSPLKGPLQVSPQAYEEEPSELSFTSPQAQSKMVTKVRELKNVNEYYEQVKKKTSPAGAFKQAKQEEKKEDFVYQADHGGLLSLQRRISNELENVDEDPNTQLRSLQ